MPTRCPLTMRPVPAHRCCQADPLLLADRWALRWDAAEGGDAATRRRSRVAARRLDKRLLDGFLGAATAVAAYVCVRGGTGVIDLHGLTAAEAKAVVGSLGILRAGGGGRGGILCLVTGVGHHSGPRGAVLRPTVRALLDASGVPCVSEAGAFWVHVVGQPRKASRRRHGSGKSVYGMSGRVPVLGRREATAERRSRAVAAPSQPPAVLAADEAWPLPPVAKAHAVDIPRMPGAVRHSERPPVAAGFQGGAWQAVIVVGALVVLGVAARLTVPMLSRFLSGVVAEAAALF